MKIKVEKKQVLTRKELELILKLFRKKSKSTRK